MQEDKHNNSSDKSAGQEHIQQPQNNSGGIQKKRQVRRLRVLETITVLLFGITQFFNPPNHKFLCLLASFIFGFIALRLELRNYTATKNNATGYALLVFIVATGLSGYALLWDNRWGNPSELKPDEAAVSRPLIPANDPLPSGPDGEQVMNAKSNIVFLFFGSCSIWSPLHNDHPITIVFGRENISGEFEWKPLVGVSIKTNGATVSGRFFDKDGKIIAVLKDNHPVINSSSSFDVQRPDASTLIVHDQYDVEALNIRYSRPRVFVFTGTIRSPDGAAALVTKSSIIIMNVYSNNPIISNMRLGNAALYIGMKDGGMGPNGPYNSN